MSYPTSQLDAFYVRLHRMGVIVWLLASVLVLIINNVPAWSENYNHALVNGLGAASLVCAAVVSRLTWQRFKRTLLLPALLGGPLVIALLVNHTGGSSSPFNVYFFVVALFSAFYYPGVKAIRVGFLVAVASLSPLFFSDEGIDRVHQHIVMALGFIALSWVTSLLASEIVHKERARRGLEENLVEDRQLREELARANDRERRRAMALQAVHGIGQEIALVLDTQALYQALVMAVHKRLGYDIVALNLLENPRGELVLVGELGLKIPHKDLVEGHIRTPRSSGIVGQVARTRISYYTGDVGSDQYYQILSTRPVRSELAVPILAGRKLLGVLNVESEKPDAFDEIDVITLEAVAGHAAVALENSRAHALLAQQASTDMLTELYNHRALIEHLDAEMERAQRFFHNLSVLFVDIDHFKQVNDTYGHQAGDIVLHKLAQLMRDSLRSVDTLGRYGGEEFVAVLPETGLDEAVRAAERLRLITAEHTFLSQGGESRQVTISVGVATFPQDGETRHDLLRSADRALYCAKRRGRNRVAMVEAEGADSPGSGHVRPLRVV